MSDILLGYDKVNPTTWVYLSSLLMIGLFFKFNRFWSVRNFDLVLLIFYAPGLLLVEYGRMHELPAYEQSGYVWLFAIGGVFLIRLLLDPMMVRRPLLEPNLSVGGMAFIGISLFVFLMASVMNSRVMRTDVLPVAHVDGGDAAMIANEPPAPSVAATPGFPPLQRLPRIATQVPFPREPASEPKQDDRVVAVASARTIAIASHVAVVLGMVLIGYRHFDNIRTGIAAAMIYLMLPYTAQKTGWWDHALPAALLVWAIEAYRRPFIAGMFIGLAVGVIYYPLFLLPLWISFYWQRGLLRFVGGVTTGVAVLAVALIFASDGVLDYWQQLQQMFAWPGLGEAASGFWNSNFIDPVWRIPVLALFFALCASFAFWPVQKNLGTLMSCSAAIMLAVQFWHPMRGGVLMSWYLPLLLLTIFRPNLEDRVALSVLGEGWLSRRRTGLAGAERAA